jgi:hypothetical protein
MFCRALLDIEDPESDAVVSLLAEAWTLFCGLKFCALRGDCLPGALVVLGGRSGIATSPLPCLLYSDRLLAALEGTSSSCCVNCVSALNVLATLPCRGGKPTGPPAAASCFPPGFLCLNRCCFFFSPCSRFMIISRILGRNRSKLC